MWSNLSISASQNAAQRQKAHAFLSHPAVLLAVRGITPRAIH
jgi:hypothetical protein